MIRSARGSVDEANRTLMGPNGVDYMNQITVERTSSGVEALLAGYVAGTLPIPLNALFSAHLELSPRNRGYVRALEAAAGSALENGCYAEALAPVRDRDAKLAAIFAAAGEPARPRPAPARADAVFPAPIARYLGVTSDAVPWKSKLPGVKHWHVADTEEGEVSLYWIRAGQKLPTHTHEGSEITLVLKGGFSDATGHYARGDVAVADQEVDHRPVADDDGEDCICFAVTDAPLRLTGAIGRWVQPFLKR